MSYSIDHEDYLWIEVEVKKVLVKYKLHLLPRNTERLYLSKYGS